MCLVDLQALLEGQCLLEGLPAGRALENPLTLFKKLVWHKVGRALSQEPPFALLGEISKMMLRGGVLSTPCPIPSHLPSQLYFSPPSLRNSVCSNCPCGWRGSTQGREVSQTTKNTHFSFVTENRKLRNIHALRMCNCFNYKATAITCCRKKSSLGIKLSKTQVKIVYPR